MALKDQRFYFKLFSLHNYICNKGAIILANVLKYLNSNLTEWYLSDNTIGDECCKGLAEALKVPNCKLTELNIASNGIKKTFHF